MPAQAQRARFRFGHFELQPTERRLLASGNVVQLNARAFDLLLALVERAGDLVTKEELLQRVWPKLVVEESNLPVQMSALRRVLGAETIETVAWARLPLCPGGGCRRCAAIIRAVTPPQPAAPADQFCRTGRRSVNVCSVAADDPPAHPHRSRWSRQDAAVPRVGRELTARLCRRCLARRVGTVVRCAARAAGRGVGPWSHGAGGHPRDPERNEVCERSPDARHPGQLRASEGMPVPRLLKNCYRQVRTSRSWLRAANPCTWQARRSLRCHRWRSPKSAGRCRARSLGH